VTTRGLPLPEINRSLWVAAVALLTAMLVGFGLAMNAPLGIAILLAAIYAPLAAKDMRLGLTLWIPLVFLEGLPALNMAGKAAGLLLVGAWVGAMRSATIDLSALRRHRRMVEVMVLLMLWLSLSMLWAPNIERATGDVWHWWAVGVVWVLVLTTLASPAPMKLALMTFVIGATLAVLVGAVEGGLTQATTAATSRLSETAGDPNFLAAGLVPASVMAAALMIVHRGLITRLALLCAIGLMAGGLVATQSRGGLVAAAATALASVAFFKRRRIHAVAVILIAMAAIASWFAVNPAAWERVTAQDNGGSGRTELWTIAGRVIRDHPLQGVGVNNFAAVSPQYVRERGSLETVNLIAEQPKQVHNMYLQILSELGAIGLALFGAFALMSLVAAQRAANIFGRLGDDQMDAVSRAVLVGTIGFLSSSVFLSLQVDRRLWILFALGPALLVAAERARSARVTGA
jgi:O-antigen ligase